MNAYRKLLLIALMVAGASAQAKRGPDIPGQFDYYAVALSWSPSYCATNRDPVQCDSGRKLGFVLHGLWPQHEAGYPQNCSTEQVPSAVRSQYTAIYPSPKLLGHEWKKHGTCSGLDPAAYFALSARFKDQLVIPPSFRQPASPLRVSPGELVQAFKSVNPGIGDQQRAAVLQRRRPVPARDPRLLREGRTFAQLQQWRDQALV